VTASRDHPPLRLVKDTTEVPPAPAPAPPGRYGAAREYKDIIAGIAESAEKLRSADRERAAELAVELAELDREMLRAGERATLTRLGVELSWEEALDALWVESWMQLRPRPGPAPGGDPERLAELDVEVEQRTADLLAAVRRRFGLGLGRGL
jgi:hypothetical protein